MKKNDFFSFYFFHIDKYIYKSIFIQGIFIIIESIITLSQFLELFNNNFQCDIIKISPPLKIVFKIKNEIILFIFFTLFIIIFDIIYLIYDHFVFSNDILSLIFINFFEILYFRIILIFYITIISNLHNYFFFIAIFIIFFHTIICIYNFQFFHLYDYSPSFTSIPYDNLSSIIDISNLFIKIFISFGFTSNKNISKFFFFLCVLIYFVISFYLLFIMLNKSFYLMNNITLSKIRLWCFFSNFFIIIFMFIYGREKLLSINFYFIMSLILLLFFLSIFLQYNPYNYIIIDDNKNEINAFFYLFCFFSSSENKIKFYEAICNHINNCDGCKLCTDIKKNKCLNSKKYKQKFFSSIYTGHNKYIFLLKNIMNIYSESQWKYLPTNPNIYINLLKLHFSEQSHKLNINLKLNIQLIYSILIEKNKAQINEEKILIEQLLGVNEFMILTKKTILQIKKVIAQTLTDSVTQLNDLEYLIKLLTKLKNQKYINHLFKKYNNSSNNLFYPLTLCLFIFEELFNECIGNKQQQLRESLAQFEEIITFLYKNNNNITLELDSTNFDLKIIRVGKELFNYLNDSLYELFPRNFEDNQKKDIINILTNFENINIKNYKDLTTTPMLNEIDLNIPEIKLLIILKHNNGIYYHLLTLHINLLFKNIISQKSIFDGEYFINDNIILTKISNTINQSEYLVGYSNHKYNKPITFNNNKNILLNDFLKINNLKSSNLIFAYSKINNGHKFNIYKYESRKRTKESSFAASTLLKIKGVETLIEQSFIDRQYREDDSSLAGSLQSGMSINDKGYIVKRNDKNNRNDINYNLLRIFQIIDIIIIIFIIVISFIQIFHQSHLKNHLLEHTTNLSIFKSFYRKFYHMFSSFISVLCTGSSSENIECINFFHEYTKKYNINNPKYQINFTKIIQYENELLANELGISLKELQEAISSLGDSPINNILYSTFYYRQIIQNNKKLYIIQNNITLYESLGLFSNNFFILKHNDNNYMKETTFILNYENDIFRNINESYKLDNIQIEIYELILNFLDFSILLTKTRNTLDEEFIEEINEFRSVTYIYFFTIFLLKLLSVVILFIYICYLDKIFIDIFNSVRKKLIHNNEILNFKELYTNKIKNLEKLIQMYLENPINIIINLNKIYSNYKKEMNESFQKNNIQNNYIYSNVLISEKKKLFSYKTYKKSGLNQKYFKILILIFSSITIYFLIEFVTWISTFSKIKIVNDVVKKSSEVEATGYKIFAYYQLMIYCNLTEEEISSIVEIYSIENEIEKKLTQIFITEQNQKEVSDLLYFLKDIIEINCNDFYYLANDSRLNKINNLFPEEKIYENLIYYCNNTYSMKEHKSEIIYQYHFGLINDGIRSIQSKNYDNIIEYLNQDYLFKSSLFNYFIYRPLRTIVNKKIINVGMENSINLIKNLFYYNLIMDVIQEICFIILIFIVFILGVKKEYKKIYQLKNVFKICN